MRPAVVFADEPTGALDTANSELVLQVLRELADAAPAWSWSRMTRMPPLWPTT